MVTNDIKHDIRVLMAQERQTQESLACNMGSTKQYINRVVNNPEKLISKFFVTMLEVMGYDIRLEYVKRKE